MVERPEWERILDKLCNKHPSDSSPRSMPATHEHVHRRLRLWVPQEARTEAMVAIDTLVRLLKVHVLDLPGLGVGEQRAAAVDSLLHEMGYGDIPSYTIDQTSQEPR